MPENTNEQETPDRPIECSECKKKIVVYYTEIVRDTVIKTCMCGDCPELQKRLYGISSNEYIDIRSGNASLECGNCGTTLEEIKRGHRLGCADCYTVFGDVLFMDLQSTNHLPLRLLNSKKNTPLHMGRSPGETLVISPSSRLLALNEALIDTLNREDYEQAALLRDQIKALTEEDHPNESK